MSNRNFRKRATWEKQRKNTASSYTTASTLDPHKQQNPVSKEKGIKLGNRSGLTYRSLGLVKKKPTGESSTTPSQSAQGESIMKIIVAKKTEPEKKRTARRSPPKALLALLAILSPSATKGDVDRFLESFGFETVAEAIAEMERLTANLKRSLEADDLERARRRKQSRAARKMNPKRKALAAKE